jgi:ATPase-like protein
MSQHITILTRRRALIKRLYVDNYKTFVNFTVNFNNINVLLGKNGSGKSNLFDLICLLRSFISGEKRLNELFTFLTLTRWQQITFQTFELELEVQEHTYIYHLEIEYDFDNNRNRVLKEVLTCDGSTIFFTEKGHARLYNDTFAEGPELLVNWEVSGISLIYERKDNKLLCAFKKAVENIVLCRIFPDKFGGKTDSEALWPDYYLSNFASVYRFMQQEHPDRLTELRTEMHIMNPAFLRSFLTGSENEKVLKLEFDINGKSIVFSFDECSEGEKALFVLYFLLICYRNIGVTLLLDEPDNTVALPEIQPWLQAVEDFSVDMSQCILISHHPEVLNYLASSYGLWFDRTGYGMTKILDIPKPAEPLTVSEYIAREWDNEDNE